jgi:tetraacyldisaccharide 4'-kinase
LLLAPAGLLYSFAGQLREKLANAYRSRLPVLCVGNYTVGGAGKTPLALLIGQMLRQEGRKPVFLSRGYRGRIRGPHLVDPATDTALDVGDEPLLLAQVAPVVVSADRAAGAGFIETLEADVIIMDDGFQNPGLNKDLSLVVVDGATGVGNGRVFPAGPLRAPLQQQIDKTDVLIVAGSPATGSAASLEIESAFDGAVFRYELVASGEHDWLQQQPLLAVTGIARPEKFFATLEGLGAHIAERCDFPDHHMFTEEDAETLLQAAEHRAAQIVMTRKDWVRLPLSGGLGKLRQEAKVLDVEAQLDQPERLRVLLLDAISSSAVPDTA